MKDRVFVEILRNRFQAVANEVATTILRAGYTVFVKETADFGVAIVSPEGEIFAAPVNLGVSVMLGMPVHAVIGQVEWEEGDVVILNDPYATRGMITHLPDVCLMRPIYHEGQLVCFALDFVHSSDIGGKVPGSISPGATDIFQEGLRIPPFKLVKRGKLDEEFLRLFLANCRIPTLNWGDLRALLSALNTADVRMRGLVDRYGLEVVRQGIRDVLDYADQRARAIISELPDGDYEFVDYLEADMAGAGLVRLKLTLRIHGDELVMDFTGSDPQVQAALNMPSFSQRSHWNLVYGIVNYFRTVDPHVPYNSGLLRPVDVLAPRGSVVNSEPPAAVGVRHATQFRTMDMTMAVLGRVAPHLIPAAGGGQLCVALLATPDILGGEMKVSVLQPLGGGSGARPNKDGIEAGDFSQFIRNVPNELLEHDMPILIHRYGLRPDSGGPGRYRGGSGIQFSFELLSPTAVMTARGMERFIFAPWGRQGGATGTTGKTFLLRDGCEEPESIGKIDVLTLGQGDLLTILSQGGGGFGNPLERDPDRVLQDVVRGLVSAEAAERDYGVVLREGAVDREATAALRASRASEAHEGEYTLGEAREAYDRRWPGVVQETLNDLLRQFPVALRAVARQMLLKELEAGRSGDDPVEPGQVLAAFDRLRARWLNPHRQRTY